MFFVYFIHHCFMCRPSDSIVSEDAGIEPRTVATSALAVRRSNHKETNFFVISIYSQGPLKNVYVKFIHIKPNYFLFHSNTCGLKNCLACCRFHFLVGLLHRPSSRPGTVTSTLSLPQVLGSTIEPSNLETLFAEHHLYANKQKGLGV